MINYQQQTTSGINNNNNNNYNLATGNCTLIKWPNEPPAQMYVQLSTFWYILLALITSVGLLVSLISNMIIIYLFTRTPSLRRNPSNIVAVNLSLSDLLYCVQWPSVIYCSMTQSTWLLEINFVCQSFGFITVSTASASVLTVLIMSIERAIVIRHSIHVRNRFTIRTSWLVLAIIWLVSILTSLPPLFGKYNRYTMDLSRTSCTIDYLSNKSNYKLYIFVIGIVYWIVPAFIITICYVLIIITFKRSSQSLKQVSDTANQLEQRRCSASTLACLETTNNSIPFNESTRRRLRFNSTKRTLRDSIRLKHYVFGTFKRYDPVGGPTVNSTIESISSRVNIATNEPAALEPMATKRPLLKRAATGIRLSRPAKERRCSGATEGNSGPEVTFGELQVTRMSLSPKESSPQQQQLCSSLELVRNSPGGPERRSTLGSASLASKREERIKSAPGNWYKTSYVNRMRLRGGDGLQQDEKDGQPSKTISRESSFQAASSRGEEDLESSSLQENSQQSQAKWGSRFNLNNLPLVGQLRNNFKSTTSINCSTLANNTYNPNLSRTALQVRLAKMSFYLILLWLISWTPIASLAMINSLIRCHQTSAFAVFMANTMTKLGPTFDVFIYGISHPKIKSKFKQIIKWMFCIGNEDRKSVFSSNIYKNNYLQSTTTTRFNQRGSQFRSQLSLRSLAGRRGQQTERQLHN